MGRHELMPDVAGSLGLVWGTSERGQAKGDGGCWNDLGAGARGACGAQAKGLPHLATFGLHSVITGVDATTGYAMLMATRRTGARLTGSSGAG